MILGLVDVLLNSGENYGKSYITCVSPSEEFF